MTPKSVRAKLLAEEKRLQRPDGRGEGRGNGDPAQAYIAKGASRGGNEGRKRGGLYKDQLDHQRTPTKHPYRQPPPPPQRRNQGLYSARRVGRDEEHRGNPGPREENRREAGRYQRTEEPSRTLCFSCGAYGHIARACPRTSRAKKKAFSARVVVASSEESESGIVSESAFCERGDDGFTLEISETEKCKRQKRAIGK